MSNKKTKGEGEMSKYMQEQVAQDKERKQMEKEFRDQLRNDPRYKKFFSPYQESSVESFIEHYPKKKARWLQHGDFYRRQKQEKELRFISMAEDRIWDIQQKKLFNLQCRWRAGQIELNEVEVTEDFKYWGDRIVSCPFLDPISGDEIELYINFWETDPNATMPNKRNWLNGMTDWQDYEEIRAEYLRGDDSEQVCNLPDWYEFYDSRRGTGSLMLLPDTRGEKESFYRKLVYEKNKEEQIKAGTYKEYVPDDRPQLHYYDLKDLEPFINQFEKREIWELCKAYETYQHLCDDYYLNDAMDTLMEADETPPMQSHHNWREAIINAAAEYERGMLIKQLRPAWERYCERIEMGIAFEEDERDYKTFEHIRKHSRERLIEGRLLNGEHGDLNF